MAVTGSRPSAPLRGTFKWDAGYPEWYTTFLAFALLASVIWCVLASVVACLAESTLMSIVSGFHPTVVYSSRTLLAVPFVVVGMILHYRNSYRLSPGPARSLWHRYIVVFCRYGNFQILVLNILLGIACSMTSTFIAPLKSSVCDRDTVICFHDLVVLRLLACIVAGLALTTEYIQNDEDVLLFPAQQGAIALRAKTAVRVSILRAFQMTKHIVPTIAVGYLIFGMFPSQKREIVSALTGAVFGSSGKSIVFMEKFEIYNIASLAVIAIPVFTTCVVALLTRHLTQNSLTQLPKSVGSLEELTASLGSSNGNAHMKRLALTGLCLLLRREPELAKVYFQANAAGVSQWDLVSKACTKIVVGMISKANSFLGSEVNLRLTSQPRGGYNGRRPTASSNIQAVPSVGLLSQIPRKQSFFHRISLKLKRLQLTMRVDGSWYQPTLTQMDALFLLSGQDDGMFVVHASDTTNTLALTVVHNAFNTFPPRKSASAWTAYICFEKNKYFLHYDFDRQFTKVSSLIKYYQTHPYTLDYAKNEKTLCSFDQAQFFQVVQRKGVNELSGTFWKVLAKMPLLPHLFAKPKVHEIEKHLGDIDFVCAALEIVGTSATLARNVNHNMVTRESQDVHVWSYVLSSLFLAIDDVCRKYGEADSTATDHVTHRRVRNCIPAAVAPIQGVVHSVICCVGKILAANKEHERSILLELDPQLMSLIPHLKQREVRYFDIQKNRHAI